MGGRMSGWPGAVTPPSRPALTWVVSWRSPIAQLQTLRLGEAEVWPGLRLAFGPVPSARVRSRQGQLRGDRSGAPGP